MNSQPARPLRRAVVVEVKSVQECTAVGKRSRPWVSGLKIPVGLSSDLLITM